MSHHHDGAVAAVRANYAAQRRAMLTADADALGALLADGFVLTHMTGYQQAKNEWLADVRSGRMTYHAIDDVDVSVVVSGTTVVLTARTRTVATIWGGHGTWPLQLQTDFALIDNRWQATKTVASVWR